jgi:hypothetical protein
MKQQATLLKQSSFSLNGFQPFPPFRLNSGTIHRATLFVAFCLLLLPAAQSQTS